MDKFDIWDINGLIESSVPLYAHTHEIKEKETLQEHSKLTFYYFRRLVKEKGLKSVISNTIIKLNTNEQIQSTNTQIMIETMFINAIYLHDIGKINPQFQRQQMENNAVKVPYEHITNHSKHAELSAIIYLDQCIELISKVRSKKSRLFLYYIAYSFGYVISRHHTYLQDLGTDQFLNNITRTYEHYKKESFYIQFYTHRKRLSERNINMLFHKDREKHQPTSLYILTKLLYSIIVSCDFYATYTYMEDQDVNFHLIEDVSPYLDKYYQTPVYKGIKAYQNDNTYFGENNINSLRSEIFLEASKNLAANMGKGNMYYLEAPTGSGKTNTSINLALEIIKQDKIYKKIFYIFPFNTLVEQTKEAFEKIWDPKFQTENPIAVINSITPIITLYEEQGENEGKRDVKQINYERDLLHRQMLHYPIVLTTHINFFNYLFGTGREINLALLQFCNSVVVIDEVQSYRNQIWPEIIKFLEAYSECLNIKIIIMSATLPPLDQLIWQSHGMFVKLLPNVRKYYEHPLFKDRVGLDFSLLEDKDMDKNIRKERLMAKINDVLNKREQTRMMIECIRKVTARDLFTILKKEYSDKYWVIEITGDDSSYQRKEIIEKINKKEKDGSYINQNIILVATQVIEAGVDIDMDIGFKDISLLDGEEQFLGRINRSCMKDGCKAYFFHLDEAGDIYKNELRLEHDLREEKYQEYLYNKDFSVFYAKTFSRLEEQKSQNNQEGILRFDQQVRYLNYQEVCDYMKLITEENCQLFLGYKLKIKENGEIKIIDGHQLWKDYEHLLQKQDMPYAEKRIRISEIKQQMEYFTYTYVIYSNPKYPKTFKKIGPHHFTTKIGRLYYLADGQDFITEDGKFDRKKYKNIGEGLFI